MTPVRAVQVLLAAVISVLVAAALYTFTLIEERQVAFANMSRYDVAWSASQAVIETHQLESALLRAKAAPSAENLEDAQLRYEILYNRANVTAGGKVAEFLKRGPDLQSSREQFNDAVLSLDALISGDALAANLDRALEVIAPLPRELSAIASEAHRYSAEAVALDQQELARLYRRFSNITLGLIFCGIGLVGLLAFNNRLLVRAHGKLKRTTADLGNSAAQLAAANRAVADANDELRKQNALLVDKEAALEAQNGLFDAALNNISQGLCMFDDTLNALVFNQQFEKLFGAGRPAASSGLMDSGRRPSLREVVPELAAELEENTRRKHPAVFEKECCDGRVISVSQQPMPNRGWVATFEEVTQQRLAEARIAHMARHDGLTNLPNRYAFRERMQSVLAGTERGDSGCAVMYLDLDHFKAVNDSLGHPAGDRLLCEAAERLVSSLRTTDMVARFGGDEFAILQTGIETRADAEQLAARIVQEISKPFNVNGQPIFMAGSVGIALTPEHGNDPDLLLKQADLALYAAKASGRHTFRFFEPQMTERLTERQAIEHDLHLALERAELDLHYQPVVNLQTGGITGFEALLRWAHPVRGMVSPSTFIPIAEECGLITDIGRWILARACADAVLWPANIKLSVNLSAAQFQRGDVTEEIASALAYSGLPPQRLMVEITESLLLNENDRTLQVLSRLRALGIEIAMDDFGTGYSSLSYLRKYPFDRLKIDRSFVKSSSGGDAGAAIIRTIVQLGASLGMTTTAEGVETPQDREMLLAAGCREAQGYLFSPAVPREVVHQLLAAQQPPATMVA